MLNELKAKVLAAIFDAGVEDIEPAAVFLIEEECKIFDIVLAEGGLEVFLRWFFFITFIFLFCGLHCLQKDIFALREMLNNLINNLHGFLICIFLFKKLVEHPIDQFLQVIRFAGKHLGYFVEVARKQKFVGLGLIEELDIDIANRVYFIELGGKH